MKLRSIISCISNSDWLILEGLLYYSHSCIVDVLLQHGANPGALPGPGGRGSGGGTRGRGAPNGSSPYQGSENTNYYPQQQGYPLPQQQQGDGPPHMGPPPSGQWGPPEGGAYYGAEGQFRGQNDPNMRRGRGFMPMRGRGRGFLPPWKRGIEIFVF